MGTVTRENSIPGDQEPAAARVSSCWARPARYSGQLCSTSCRSGLSRGKKRPRRRGGGGKRERSGAARNIQQETPNPNPKNLSPCALFPNQMHRAAFFGALGPPSRVLGTERADAPPPTICPSGGGGTALLLALILPLPCPPPFTATGFQIREISAHSGPLPTLWLTPAACWPQTGSDRPYWPSWRGRLWPAWREISKRQGTAGEMANKPLTDSCTKEMSAVLWAFGCAAT